MAPSADQQRRPGDRPGRAARDRPAPDRTVLDPGVPVRGSARPVADRRPGATSRIESRPPAPSLAGSARPSSGSRPRRRPARPPPCRRGSAGRARAGRPAWPAAGRSESGPSHRPGPRPRRLRRRPWSPWSRAAVSAAVAAAAAASGRRRPTAALVASAAPGSSESSYSPTELKTGSPAEAARARVAASLAMIDEALLVGQRVAGEQPEVDPGRGHARPVRQHDRGPPPLDGPDAGRRRGDLVVDVEVDDAAGHRQTFIARRTRRSAASRASSVVWSSIAW